MPKDGKKPKWFTMRANHVAGLNRYLTRNYTIDGNYAYCKLCPKRLRFAYERRGERPGTTMELENCRKHVQSRRKK